LPPLRNRAEDIQPLAEHFLRVYSRKFGKSITGFSPEVLAILKKYDWPGNVREFRNVIERSCILTKGAIIDNPAVLFPGSPMVAQAMQQAAGNGNTVAEPSAAAGFQMPAMPLGEAEKMVILAAMRDAEGNKNKAAAILGLHRTTLYKKLEEYHIG